MTAATAQTSPKAFPVSVSTLNQHTAPIPTCPRITLITNNVSLGNPPFLCLVFLPLLSCFIHIQYQIPLMGTPLAQTTQALCQTPRLVAQWRQARGRFKRLLITLCEILMVPLLVTSLFKINRPLPIRASKIVSKTLNIHVHA